MSETPITEKKVSPMDVATLGARLIVGGIFLFYSFGKIAEPTEFLKSIREYQVFPDDPALPINLTAAILPWIELIGGLALISGLLRRGAALTLSAMLIVFTVAIFVRAVGVQAGTGTPFCDIVFDCGCGSGEVVVCGKLAKNIGLIILGAFCLLSNSAWLSFGRPVATSSAHPPQPPGVP